MSSESAPKFALVTGGNRGIGFAICRGLLQAGFEVFLAARSRKNANTFSPIVITQAFIPLLEKAEHPKVINISSGNGQFDGISSQVPSYSLSKLALNGATILLADSLASNNIAVYAMCPGWVRTDMGGESAPRTPEEGADTAIWLATEAGMAESGKFFRDRTERPY